MKNTPKSTHAPRQLTPREFVCRALTASGVVLGATAFLLGQNLHTKLDIAFIACGCRANASFGELTVDPNRSTKKGGKKGAEDPHAGPHPDENVAVICDINQMAIDAASARFPKAK